MKAYPFGSDQYGDLVDAWWKVWHQRPLHPDLHAQNGIVIQENGEVLVIGYLYPTVGSKVAYLGFTVRKPDLNPIRSDAALKLLLTAAEELSWALGYSILHTTFESKAMRARVAEAGFTPCGETQIFVKDLKPHGTTT